eukprot:COSAG02_NODE_4358_length_5457_cov_2.064390_3_plen_73_part_00
MIINDRKRENRVGNRSDCVTSRAGRCDGGAVTVLMLAGDVRRARQEGAEEGPRQATPPRPVGRQYRAQLGVA